MHRGTTRIRQPLALAALAAVLGVLPVAAIAEGDWSDEGAVETRADQLDDHEAGSENPDDRTVGSEDLNDLPAARPDSGEESIEAPGQARWEATTDPEVVIARDKLVRAERRATAADKAYGEMRQNNYPRGDARVRIVKERDEAMQGLEEAKRALATAEE